MLFAGIAWTDQGFDVALMDEQGELAKESAHFPASQIQALIDYLCGLDHPPTRPLLCIVDSTNGMIDGGMMSAGLRVYSADPSILPFRPALGSVDARTLAQTGVDRLPDLRRLAIEGGSLTGRLGDHNRHIKESGPGTAALVEAGRCIEHGVRSDDDKVVALTFDDGPNPPYTNRVLDTLDRYSVPATFFCVGLHASVHGEELCRMTESGHQLGNHTWSHPFLPDLSPRETALQLERTDEAIALATSRESSGLFRPPYGSRTPELLSWLGEDREGPTVVLWDVEPLDWALPGPEAIAHRVLEQAKPGSIVLLHDGGGDRSQTAQALPAVIEGLLAKDYRFGLVSELVGKPE